MIEFAGYALPLRYEGIIAEHLACRQGAALFDVSHMGQVVLADAVALERVVPSDILGLPPGRQRYSLLLNAEGGIVDDLMVANFGDRLQLVLNASRVRADLDHLAAHGVAATLLPDRALLALQGPAAAAMLPEAAAMRFMDARDLEISGIPCAVTRSGYTGEDGFEIGCPAGAAERLAEFLLAKGARPAGLGARDSLRLEAGFCLYGNDIDETTDPISANLGWTVSKRRKLAWDFLGSEAVRAALAAGPRSRLVGIRPQGRAPARAGVAIRQPGGALIGRVTSGGFAPSLDAPVALAYVESDSVGNDSVLELIIRDKPIPAEVTPLPFVPHRYVR